MILALTSASVWAAAQGVGAASQPVFTSSITHVEVYATVTDAQGRPIEGLHRDDFVLLEDGVRQEITAFAAGAFPAAVALAIDRSFSMRGRPLSLARTAARAFLGSLRPDDRVMLLGISGQVEVLAPLARDRTAAFEALARLDPWSTTALHDALIQSMDLLDDQTGRRAIVVLSDGVDRYSSASAADVVSRARRSDVLIYTVAIAKQRPRLFEELARISGGRAFRLSDPAGLQPTLLTIAHDLRAQYLLGYAPSRPVDTEVPEWRRITVEVRRPGASVRARSGYSTR